MLRRLIAIILKLYTINYLGLFNFPYNILLCNIVDSNNASDKIIIVLVQV